MFATPSADKQRRRALRSAPSGPLRDYLQTPFPDPRTEVGDLQLLAVDLETTGLHPKNDRLLSIGFVPIDGLSIDLSGARRFVVQAGVEVGQSAAIHGLTDDTVAAGTPIDEALPVVLEALRGRVLLAHYTDIEERFLSAACERVYGTRLPVARIDLGVAGALGDFAPSFGAGDAQFFGLSLDVCGAFGEAIDRGAGDLFADLIVAPAMRLARQREVVV